MIPLQFSSPPALGQRDSKGRAGAPSARTSRGSTQAALLLPSKRFGLRDGRPPARLPACALWLDLVRAQPHKSRMRASSTCERRHSLVCQQLRRDSRPVARSLCAVVSPARARCPATASPLRLGSAAAPSGSPQLRLLYARSLPTQGAESQCNSCQPASLLLTPSDRYLRLLLLSASLLLRDREPRVRSAFIRQLCAVQLASIIPKAPTILAPPPPWTLSLLDRGVLFAALGNTYHN